MNWSVLKDLLDRYYEGQSSEEDEKKLVEMMQRDDLPEEFLEDRTIINGLFSHDEIPEPSMHLESKIRTAIDESEKNIKTYIGKSKLYSLVSVAASIIIILSFWFILHDRTGLKDTYEDPRLAYNQTVEVLYRVSENLNRGRDQIQDLSHITETKSRFGLIRDSREQIEEDLEALKYIEKSIEIMGNINNR